MAPSPAPRLAKSYAANALLVVLTLFPGLINTSAIALAAPVIGKDLGVAPDAAAGLPLISDAALAFGCLLAAELTRRVSGRTLYFGLHGVRDDQHRDRRRGHAGAADRRRRRN